MQVLWLKEWEYTHPFYWAGFVLIGDDAPLDTRLPWKWYALVGVALTGLILGRRLLASRWKV